MQLRISFFDQRKPELLGLCAVPVQRRLGGWVVGDARVDRNELPKPVLEELKDSKSKLNAIVDDQVFEKLRVQAHRRERAQEPSVVEDALLDIAWGVGVLHHDWLVTGEYLVRAFPLHVGDVGAVLRG